jgi:hypothetical protein
MKFFPLVTIIIPVFNGADFLNEAIDCALAQSYKNIEIIVINDGSADNGATENVALSYGDKIRYIKKPNGGVSSALNQAIEASNGEYFSWLSHDDLYYPDKISKEVEFLNRIMEENPKEDRNRIIIHCATVSVDKEGKIIKVPSYRGVDEVESNIKVIIDNVYNYRLSGCSFLIPKAAYQDIGGFDEGIRTVSDVEYWYRLLFRDYHFYCLTKERLVKNRSHKSQVGKTKADLFEKELNELHISIANQLISREEYNTSKILEKYYFGLIKRGMKQASEYVMREGLGSKVSLLRARLIIPIKKTIWTLRGLALKTARKAYRKLMVH